MKRLGNRALGALLACSLVPVPAGAAWADEPAAGAGSGGATSAAATQLTLEPGTYVEHEAIAYVVDGGVRLFSFNGGALESAQNLMDIEADAAAEALGDDVDAPEAAAFARSLSANGEAEAAAGRLVLVRDEAKTTEQLIAELEADPRVVFAEPNAVVETGDADKEAPQAALADEALIKEWVTEAATADAVGGPDAAGMTGKTGLTANGAAGGADGDALQGGDAGAGDALKGAAGSNGAEGASANDGNASDSDAAEPRAGEPAEVVWGEDDEGPASDLDDFVWGFSNDGRMGGIAEGDAVDMGYDAWADKTAGNLEEVIVAVIDSGVDASNPDLAPVMWKDGLTSGIVSTGKEDQYGFAAAADQTAGITSTTGITSYHGTHVAGTIGAAWDDEGVSGLAPNARIMAVRHDDTLAGMLECFDYVSRARDAGVDVRVSNNSWGFGQGMWRSIDLAVTEIGRQGVVSVFASGNSAFDNDAAASTATTLADNPYAIVVNAVDPTGEGTTFTQYGETTTDVMAPGSGILSTWATGKANAEGGAGGPNYLGEEDDDAVLYESFDKESHASAFGEGQTGAASSEGGNADAARGTYLSFSAKEGASSLLVREGGKRFDGNAALELSYDPVSGDSPFNVVASDPIDLSGVDKKPRYLSIRTTATSDATDSTVLGQVAVLVKQTDDPVTGDPRGTMLTPVTGSSFGIGGDSWSGFTVEFPEDVDWENFQIQIAYLVAEMSMQGGVHQTGSPVPATLTVDSIGLGSDLVPYGYQQGTSMASPAVAGAAAVLAGKGLADVAGDEAKSAEKLAALVKGAAVRDERYAGLCSTSGYATVDGAGNPGPAITAVRDKGVAVEIEGYFMPEGATTVRLGDVEAEVEARASLGDEKARLTVRKSAGFVGGQTVVRVEASGKLASHRADLGARADATYYDQANLPVPDELATWGAWQLVGFDGSIYCLPRTTTFAEEPSGFDHLLRYLPDRQTWEQVPLPADLVAGAGLQGVIDVSGATLGGALVLQLADAPGPVAFVRYTASGAWELIDYAFSIADGAPVYATLASDGENAYLFSGLSVASGAAADNTAIYRVNFDASELEECGELLVGRIRPQVSYGNGLFAVSGGVSVGYQLGGVSGVEVVEPQSGGMNIDTGEEIPEGWLLGESIDATKLVDETGQLAWASGALADGFALVGPESNDGVADTYTLAGNGRSASELTAYAKRASWQKLLAPAATAYRGQLYVLASAQNEPYRVFSATAVETTEQPGDYVAPDPKPKPDPKPAPTPTPTPGVEQTNANASGKTPRMLVSTGDPLVAAVPILAGVGVLALVGAVVAAMCRRRAGRGRR